jgi:hypothetical protein
MSGVWRMRVGHGLPSFKLRAGSLLRLLLVFLPLLPGAFDLFGCVLLLLAEGYCGLRARSARRTRPPDGVWAVPRHSGLPRR